VGLVKDESADELKCFVSGLAEPVFPWSFRRVERAHFSEIWSGGGLCNEERGICKQWCCLEVDILDVSCAGRLVAW